MDFLIHCEDVSVGHSISGALEFEKADEFSFSESAHEVLNFIKNTDIPRTE
jgi:hypothetical protein